MTEPKVLSAAAHMSINAPESAEAWIWLLTVLHPDFVAPIRLARNWRAIESRGNVFIAFPFAPAVAQEQPSRPPRLSIRIGNVSRLVTAKLEAIQASSDTPTVTLEVVLASQPNEVEFILADFEFRRARYGTTVISANLEVEDFLSTSYPDLRYTPEIAPGTHKT